MKSIKFAVVAMTILLGMSLTITAQAETKQSAANQTVTTDDGRKVILKSSGTWLYADKKSNAKGGATLSFETGLVLKSGDVKPVSRTTFYLLDNSFAKILFDAGIKKGDGKEFENPGSIYSSFVVDYEYSGASESSTKFVKEAMQLIKPHVAQEVTTGFDGKATFKPVPVGTYYLMGHSKVSGNYVMWDTKVDISSGKNFITLDQNNTYGK